MMRRNNKKMSLQDDVPDLPPHEDQGPSDDPPP